MRTLLILLLLCSIARAETVIVDQNDPNVTYTIPTEQELQARAEQQAVVDAKVAQDKAVADLKLQIDQNAKDIANAFADDNTALVAQLKAQRNALKAQLNVLEE